MSSHRNYSAIAVVDSNEFRRAGIIKMLEPWCGKEKLKIDQYSAEVRPEEGQAAAAADAGNGKAKYKKYKLLIVNVGGDGLSANGYQQDIKNLRTFAPETPLVVMSDREDHDDIRFAITAGAQGFIVTNIKPALAMQALSFVLNGGSYFPLPSLQTFITTDDDRSGVDAVDARAPAGTNGCNDGVHIKDSLTPRQQEVLKIVGEGKSNKAIARELGMTEGTVKVHLRNIMYKLGATNRTQLAIAVANEAANAG